MKNIYTKIAVSLLLVIASVAANAQLVHCNVFLQGAHIEVGINTNGAYGSSYAPPAGYHPNGGSTTWNACDKNCPTHGLGFVADPDKDGWTVGTPYPYYGDYFLPGDPQEGWSLEINGAQWNAWNGSSWDGCGSDHPFARSPNGTTWGGSLSGNNTVCDTAGSLQSGVWQGVMDSVQVTQVTTLDTNKVFFTVFITLKNTASDTAKNVFYLRTLDPDNAQPETGSFVTDNTVTYQLPNARHRTLVSAIGTTDTGTDISAAYLGLGTLDCRAKCFIIKGSLTPDVGNLDSMYEANGGLGDTTAYLYSGELVNDVGIGLVFKLGDIPPGDSVGFAYAYVLRQADLDSAFLTTLPRWTDYGDSTPHTSGDTALVCKNSTIALNITNGSYYTWTWYGTGLDKYTGTQVNATIGTAIKTFMAVGSNPACGADTLVIVLNPDLSPTPYPDSILYCQGSIPAPLQDTQRGLQHLRYYYTNSATDTGQSYIIPHTDSIGRFTFYVSQTVRGCTSDRAPFYVTVRPPLPALPVHSNGVLCLGDNLMMYTDSANLPGYTFSWTGPDNFTSTDQNPVVPDIKQEDTTYTLIADSANCPTYPSVVHVPLHAITAVIGVSRYTVCLFDTLQISSVGLTDTGSIYTWNFGTADVLSGSGGGPYIVKWDTTGTKQIKLHIASGKCPADDSATFEVNTEPPVGFDLKKDVCVGDTTMLQVADYSLQNALSIGLDADSAKVINSEQEGHYVLTWLDSGYKLVVVSVQYPLCLRYHGDSVYVHSLPSASVQNVSKNDICIGDTVTFTAAVQGAGYNFKWEPAAYFIKSAQDGNMAMAAIPQSGYIYLTVTDQYGCVGNDSVDITAQPCCGVYLPTAFTPNGDGKNDIFRPITIGHHNLKVFRVVNRWGQTVFESNNETMGWDGKLFGVPQDIGTYFWYINYVCDGKTIEEKGEVTLIR